MQIFTPVRKQITPLPPKADPTGKPPAIYAKLRLYGWAFYAHSDGRETFLFRKFTFWPSKDSQKKATHLANKLDRFMELAFDRGYAAGMHPDDKLIEPKVHTDDGSVYHVQMYPFAMRRLTSYHWMVAYAGWVADLIIKPTGIALVPRGKPNLVEHSTKNVRSSNSGAGQKRRVVSQPKRAIP